MHKLCPAIRWRKELSKLASNAWPCKSQCDLSFSFKVSGNILLISRVGAHTLYLACRDYWPDNIGDCINDQHTGTASIRS